MAKTIKGNFSANGDSVELKNVSRFTILAGTDTNNNFGDGTLTVKIKQDPQLDWTSDSVTFTSMDAKTSIDFVGGVQVKLTLSGSTSPDLDYSITYE